MVTCRLFWLLIKGVPDERTKILCTHSGLAIFALSVLSVVRVIHAPCHNASTQRIRIDFHCPHYFHCRGKHLVPFCHSLFLLQLNKSLTYIKVDGQTFLVRTGFRRKYKVTCDDLKSIYCQKIVHSGSKGTTTEHRINITFKNGKLVKIN